VLRKLLILLATAVAMLLIGPGENTPAHADLMQCPYPATGFQAIVQPLIGQAVGYICNYPTERNLTHLHAEFGGYTMGGTGGFASGGVAGGVTFGIGMSMWSQSWRCPDERYIAAPPNGIGAWGQPLNFQGVKCPAVSRAPLALNAPWPPEDPNIEVVVNQILPPGEPDPTAAPPPDAPPPPPPAPPLLPPLPTAQQGLPEGPEGSTTNLNPVPTNPVPLQPNGR
jgi:hypothetical protein